MVLTARTLSKLTLGEHLTIWLELTPIKPSFHDISKPARLELSDRHRNHVEPGTQERLGDGGRGSESMTDLIKQAMDFAE